MLQNRHVFAKPSDCPVLASYQMWFCQKMLKNVKTNNKIVKIWLFLWNPHLIAPKSRTSCFCHFLTMFGQKLLKNTKNQKFWILELPDVAFHKKYGKFCSISVDLFINHIPWNCEECYGSSVDIFGNLSRHSRIPVDHFSFSYLQPRIYLVDKNG